MAPLRNHRRTDTARGQRRARGTLESAILTILWEAGEPLNPSEVRERFAANAEGSPGDLAYTTVVTILTRLFEKNVLSRERDGRAFRYCPVTDEAGLAARRLTSMLDAESDRRAVLSRFVKDLSDHDEQLLRAVLDSRPQSPATDAERA